MASAKTDNGQPGQRKESYEGKLELTWANKRQALLAHEDSSYEWLPPTDYRIAEVRLLRDAAKVGKVRPASVQGK